MHGYCTLDQIETAKELLDDMEKQGLNREQLATPY
jgi:pentatricopeptide repeat protein